MNTYFLGKCSGRGYGDIEIIPDKGINSLQIANLAFSISIGELYADKEKVKPKLLFIAVIIDEKGKKLCEELGIQLITYDELED